MSPFEQVAEDVEEDLRRVKEDLSVGYRGQGLCLYAALFSMLRLNRLGYRVRPAAGTVMWPIVDPQDDDGVMDTHFSCVWTPGQCVNGFDVELAGRLPEMHVWVRMPTVLVFDCSLPTLRELAKVSGVTWRTADPPRLFVASTELPDGVEYREYAEATTLASDLLTRMLFTFEKEIRGWMSR